MMGHENKCQGQTNATLYVKSHTTESQTNMRTHSKKRMTVDDTLRPAWI
jgi:hypothetical protein